ncbi:MAG: hypothetical protein HY862_02690 [Chloroflexi bacterium]|nr:hypothetical protein [Chloroflexota bacterium]
MRPLDRLLTATNETEFFVLICQLVNVSDEKPLSAKLASIKTPLGVGLQLTVRQAMRYRTNDGTLLQWDTTHVFTLDEQGALSWWMPNQPIITGLKDIQASLKQWWEKEPATPVLGLLA